MSGSEETPTRPEPSALVLERLAPCGRRPNCVSTLDERPRHAIRPILCPVSQAEALDTIHAVMAALPRTRLVAAEGPMLRYECRTRWLRLLDDVTFVVDEAAGEIHFRSSTRLGYSDLGHNRRRMETVRRMLSRAWGGAPGRPADR